MKSLGRAPRGRRLERIRASPRWIEGRFRNPEGGFPEGEREVPMPWREFFLQRGRRRPEGALPLRDPSRVWTQPPDTGLRATWLGHATVLVEIGGARVLTDPVWSARASPVRFVGPSRFHPVPVDLAALPPLDLVLISHDHYDHLDYRTIRGLAPTGVPFLVPLGVGAHLEAWGIGPERITEVDWWERYETRGSDVKITSTPARHFSGRSLGGRNQTLWTSFVLESADHRMYFGGDTGFTEQFSEIGERFGHFDLAALEIGAHHRAWADIHMGPERAIDALELLGGGPLLPIHWATFELSTHDWDQPIEAAVERASDAGAEILTPRVGEPLEPGRSGESEAWWRTVGGR